MIRELFKQVGPHAEAGPRNGITAWPVRTRRRAVARRGAVTPPARPQIKTLSDAHAVAQRKLDAILAGQSM
jgi:hypothetical protein